MLPQLKELAGKYGFDGVWMDGDCGFAKADYSERALKAFQKKTGYDKVDDDPASDSHIAFIKMQREKFNEELLRYVKDMKEEYPDFEIICSWANSYLMAEQAISCLEYHSNDVYDSAIIGADARAFAGLDKPWDLMTYAFPRTFNSPHFCVRTRGERNVKRIERDAAIIISLGGMYQVDNMLGARGEVRMTELEAMKQLSAFVHARQPFCQGSKPAKNAAIWCSCEESIRMCKDGLHERMPNLVFADWIVTDGGRPVDIVYDDVILSDRIFEHPAVIIPGVTKISPEYREAFLNYMERGGKVIAIGADTCKAFTEVTGDENREMYFEQDIYMEGVIRKRVVTFPDDMEQLTRCHIEEMKPESPSINAAAWKKVGAGALYCIGWDITAEYGASYSFLSRDFMRTVLDKADPKPEAYLESDLRCIQVIPAEKDGKKIVNLVNMIDSQDSCNLNIELPKNKGKIPPAVDIMVAAKFEQKPEKLWLEPEHKELDFSYDGEYVHVAVPRLDIHGIIVAENAE